MRDVEGAVPYRIWAGGGMIADVCGTSGAPSPTRLGWWWGDCGCMRDVEGAVPYEVGLVVG